MAGEGVACDTVNGLWPSLAGTLRGASVTPLSAAAPATAVDNPALYELLALVDAVRLGRARERTRARQLLRGRIMPAASDGVEGRRR